MDTSISLKAGFRLHQNSSLIWPTAYRSRFAVVVFVGRVTVADSVWPAFSVFSVVVAPCGRIGTTWVGTPACCGGAAGPVSLIASPASAGEPRLTGWAGAKPGPAG